MNFKKGDYVLYGKSGVCLIDDIKECDFLKKDTLYYILKPVGSRGSTFYVPLDSDTLTAEMHPLMTKDELDEVILSTKGKSLAWPEQKGERADCFKNIISGGDRAQLVLLARCIYGKKREKLLAKKHLASLDETMLKTAEKLIDEEFSHVLGCPEEDVRDYILQKLGAAE